jgi:hypothetical protein
MGMAQREAPLGGADSHDLMYLWATSWVLRNTDATTRLWWQGGRRVKLPDGVPHEFIGGPVLGPQCATVTLRIRDEDWKTVEGLGERFAMAARSSLARVYRELDLVRVEFTLPPTQWREVRLAELPHRPEGATIGRKALGPAARVGWDTPHKAVFGGSQSGKTTCLADFILSLARAHKPDDYRLLILNPKNDKALHPFARLAHLSAPVANNYEDSLALLHFALGEMERRRGNSQLQEQAPRWVVVVDEVAQLVEIHPEAGAFITQLSQMAGGLKINLVVASQAANPTVFGDKGSLARANFASRLVFQLPHDQSYLATGLAGQHTERLGGKGDGLAITGGRVTRFRAALPQRQDFEVLPFRHAEPEMPESYLFAGDAALEENGWQVPPDMLAYALVVKNSATQIQAHFGGSMNKSRVVRDYAIALRRAVNALQQRRTTV